MWSVIYSLACMIACESRLCPGVFISPLGISSSIKIKESTQKLTVYVQIDNYAMHRVLERNRLFLTSRYDTLKNFKILYSSTNDRI